METVVASFLVYCTEENQGQPSSEALQLIGSYIPLYVYSTLYKALTKSVMTHACPTWEYEAPVEQYPALLEILTGAHCRRIACGFLN
jgi:hypothetical protein